MAIYAVKCDPDTPSVSKVDSAQLAKDLSTFDIPVYPVKRPSDLMEVGTPILIKLYNLAWPIDKQVTKFETRSIACDRVFAVLGKLSGDGEGAEAPVPEPAEPKPAKPPKDPNRITTRNKAGVISAIKSACSRPGGANEEELRGILGGAFPDRNLDGMIHTGNNKVKGETWSQFKVKGEPTKYQLFIDKD